MTYFRCLIYSNHKSSVGSLPLNGQYVVGGANRGELQEIDSKCPRVAPRSQPPRTSERATGTQRPVSVARCSGRVGRT